MSFPDDWSWIKDILRQKCDPAVALKPLVIMIRE